jgi:ATP-binding cassette, subfamily B, bacterial
MSLVINAKRIFAYYRPYRGALAADLFFASLASLVVLAYPIVVNRVTQTALATGGIAPSFLLRMAGIFLFLMIVEYASNFYTDYLGHAMGARMEFDMRNDLFGHVQRLSFQYYDDTRTGELMSRITSDLLDVSELAHHGPEDLVISLVRIAGAFFILGRINWLLTAAIFLLLPFMCVFAYHYSGRVKEALVRNKERIADVNSQTEDSLAGIRVVQSFANEDIEMAKFRSSNGRFLTSRKNGYLSEALFFNGMTAFISFMTVLVVIVGAVLISQGRLLITDLITFLLYIATLIEPARRLVNFTHNLQGGVAGFERFLELLAVEPDIADAPGAVELSHVQGKVEFDDVGFRYAHDGDYVFRNIALTAQPGECIALVGSSGVGKTTLCNLIPRFYAASEGTIRIDGIDNACIQLKSLRDSIGVVQQDVYLFAGTVRENIRYGKPDATDEEIVAAARNANAHEFIMSLPGGYDAYIGQRGVKLSGGQKQRISIARVFLKDPPILILDEATSALDNESERVVQDSFGRLTKDRTTLIIAHRLSTIKNADRIVVLSEQGIAEEGTHAGLLANGGTYARLYQLAQI